MRSHLLGIVVVTLITGLASVAAADENRPTTEISTGMLLGSYRIGPAKGFAGGVHVGLSQRFGNIRLLGELGLLRVGDSDDDEKPIQGTMTRIGLMGRYTVFHGGDHSGGGEVWLEGGWGREFIGWDGGGQLTRDDIGFGMGLQAAFNAKKGESSSRWIGYSMSFRGFVARDPMEDLPLPAVCAGPCDTPTRGNPNFGFFFNYTINFGR